MSAKAVAGRFSAAAPTYAEAASVQQRVADEMANALRGLSAPGRILEIGCGTGVLTRKLVEGFPQARITAVDVAPGMINQARSSFRDQAVEWVVQDARNYRSDNSFQLIVSSSALHWLPPFAETFRHLAGMLSDGGHLVAALMVEGTLDALAEVRGRVVPGSPPAVRLPSVDAVLDAVSRAGLRLGGSEIRVFREKYTSVEAMLQGLRAQGVTGKAEADARPLNRVQIQAMIDDYRERWTDPDGSATAAYRVLFLHADKGYANSESGVQWTQNDTN